MNKKTLYIDMDGVLVDFQSGINQLSEETLTQFENNLDEVSGIIRVLYLSKAKALGNSEYVPESMNYHGLLPMVRLTK